MYMGFALGSGRIDQSGTDTNLSGMVGISGVTVTTTGTGSTVFKTYTLTGLSLYVFGTLTIDPTVELLVFDGTSAEPVVRVMGGNILNLGIEKTVLGYTYQTKGTALIIPDGGHGACCSGSSMQIDGTLNLIGATIHLSACSVWAAGSNINIKNGTIKAIRADLFRIRNSSSSVTIDGLTITGNLSIDFFMAPLVFKGFTPRDGSRACEVVDKASGGTGSPYIFNDYDSGAMVTDFSMWQLIDLQFHNLKKTTPPLLTNYGNTGQCQVFKHIKPVIIDTSGTPLLGVKYYVKDTNNGNRNNNILYNGKDYNLLSDKIYSGVTDVNGATPEIIILTRVAYIPASTTIWDYRSINNSYDDLFTINFIHYNKGISQSKRNLNGSGLLTFDWTLIPDTTITEVNKVVVDAYTVIDTAFKLYDISKSHLYDTYAGESSELLTREGSDINAGSYDVTIDPLATTTFSKVWNAITFKATTYTGGIVTSGVVYLTGACTLINGTYVNLNIGSGAILTGLNITGTLTITSAGTYTMTDCTIANVVNTSGGSIIISSVGTTNVATNTGPNVVVQSITTLTLSGLQSGSDVVLLRAGTNTVLGNIDSNVGTSWNYTYTTVELVDIGVIKAGYIVNYIYGYSLSGTDASLPITQIIDRNYI